MTRSLTAGHVDALKELINIGMGRAAGVLNQMVQAHLVLEVPSVEVLAARDLPGRLAGYGLGRLSAVSLDFRGAFSGLAELVIPPDSASRLVATLTGEELGTPDLDSVRCGTLTEVGNIVLNGVMGAIVNVLGERLHFGLPVYVEETVDRLIPPDPDGLDATVLMARARFSAAPRCIEGDVLVVFRMGAFEQLLLSIDRVLSREKAG